jgi:hypothetical protein
VFVVNFVAVGFFIPVRVFMARLIFMVSRAEPPEIDMTRSFRRQDVYSKLCDVISPTIVDRESSAVVNFDSADRCAGQ